MKNHYQTLKFFMFYHVGWFYIYLCCVRCTDIDEYSNTSNTVLNTTLDDACSYTRQGSANINISVSCESFEFDPSMFTTIATEVCFCHPLDMFKLALLVLLHILHQCHRLSVEMFIQNRAWEVGFGIQVNISFKKPDIKLNCVLDLPHMVLVVLSVISKITTIMVY